MDEINFIARINAKLNKIPIKPLCELCGREVSVGTSIAEDQRPRRLCGKCMNLVITGRADNGQNVVIDLGDRALVIENHPESNQEIVNNIVAARAIIKNSRGN